MRKLPLYLICFLISLLASCGGKDSAKEAVGGKPARHEKPDTALARRLRQFADAPRVQGKVSLAVWDLDADTTLFLHNADQAQPAASCMKLLTGIAALQTLGKDTVWTTPVSVAGVMRGDTLVGDVTIGPSLDPQLNADALAALADSVRRSGIRVIKGQARAAMVMEEPVKAEEHWYPWDLTLSKYALPYRGRATMERAWRAALAAKGIKIVAGEPQNTAKPRTIAVHRTTIEPVLRLMWKNSSNTQATALAITLGHRTAQRRHQPNADPTTTGVNVLRTFLRGTLHQRDTALTVHDGCGLCVHNSLTSSALVAVLRYGWQRPAIKRMMMQDLAVSGVDGTLRGLITQPELRGRIHAKTGTLSHPYGISNLAGVCQGPDGHWLAFSIMCSEMSVLDARVLQRKFCATLCLTPRQPRKK